MSYKKYMHDSIYSQTEVDELIQEFLVDLNSNMTRKKIIKKWEARRK